jgi:hypothetical protein
MIFEKSNKIILLFSRQTLEALAHEYQEVDFQIFKSYLLCLILFYFLS